MKQHFKNFQIELKQANWTYLYVPDIQSNFLYLTYRVTEKVNFFE